MKNKIICILTFSLLLLSLIGCGNINMGKIYFEATRFPHIKGKIGSSRGVCVYNFRSVKNLYNQYGAPAVTKSGKKLIGFTSGKGWHIAIVDLVKKKERIIKLNHRVQNFSWFPDEKRIAIVGNVSKSLMVEVDNIYIYDIEENISKKITHYPEGNNRLPIYKICVISNGKYIIYIKSALEPDGFNKCVKLNLDTGNETILPWYVNNIAAMPEKNIIALSVIINSGFKGKKGIAKIILYDIDKETHKDIEIPGDYSWIESLSFSPDGKKIAYVRSEKYGGKTLWVVNVDGTGNKQLIKKNYFITHLNWTR